MSKETIKFITIAEWGAMGYAGSVELLAIENGQLTLHYGNRNIHTGEKIMDMEEFYNAFSEFKNTQCFIGECRGLPEGWKYIDLGFGNNGNTSVSKQTGFLADIAGALVNENNIPYAKRANWICRLREDSAFVEKINQRWNSVRADVENYFTNDFASNLESIKNDAELNFVRWPILGESVWNVPSGFETRTTYDSEIDYFNNWFKNRMVWLNSNF